MHRTIDLPFIFQGENVIRNRYGIAFSEEKQKRFEGYVRVYGKGGSTFKTWVENGERNWRCVSVR